MSASYPGLPAAKSVQQSIILAQLELLRRLDPTRVATAKAALLRTIKLLGAAGLIVASTAQAQAPEGGVVSRVPASYTVDGAAEQSSFLAEIRGDVTTGASGEAEFGPATAGDGASAGVVVSLGGRGDQGAILFTRLSRTPLSVGRYRISDRGNGGDEIGFLAAEPGMEDRSVSVSGSFSAAPAGS